MLHGHIVEFPYFKFKRNHSAELYGFIYMKIHGKYGSASAERIGRHDCHEGNLSRTRDSISDNRTAASDHVLPDVPLNNTVTDDGKHICVVPHECRESVRFILAFDIKRYRHICAGSCRDVFNTENNVVIGWRSGFRICRDRDCAQNNSDTEQHCEEFFHFRLLIFYLYRAA